MEVLSSLVKDDGRRSAAFSDAKRSSPYVYCRRDGAGKRSVGILTPTRWRGSGRYRIEAAVEFSEF